jgi:type IV pilus assembly protein PilM
MSFSSVKNKNLFFKAFPVPEYLSMPAVGVDISDYAIKYVKLNEKNDNLDLGAYGKVDLPLEVIERGEIKDNETIVKLLSRIKDSNDFKFAHLALPEEHAYLFQLSLPKGDKDEVEQMLEFHLKENVPIGADESLFDYSIIKEDEKNFELNVSVYPLNIAIQYINALEEAGFTTLSVEIEGQATARSLVDAEEKTSVLIIDIGRNDASLSISTNGVVTFTAGLETGGDNFTRAIARSLDVSFQEAEKLKREHGFKNTKMDKMVHDSLSPVVAEFAETIRKHLVYWQMHMNDNSAGYEDVSSVVLVGGNANITGLAEFLEKTLGVSVEVGDVWKNIFSYEEYIPEMSMETSLEYTTAIGLALRSILRNR